MNYRDKVTNTVAGKCGLTPHAAKLAVETVMTAIQAKMPPDLSKTLDLVLESDRGDVIWPGWTPTPVALRKTDPAPTPVPAPAADQPKIAPAATPAAVPAPTPAKPVAVQVPSPDKMPPKPAAPSLIKKIKDYWTK